MTIHTDGKDQYFSHQFVAIAAQAYTIRDRLNKSRTVVQIKCHKDSAKDNITPLHSFIPTLSVLEMITSGHETKLTASAILSEVISCWLHVQRTEKTASTSTLEAG